MLIADEFNHRIRRVAPTAPSRPSPGSGAQDCELQSGLASAAQFAWPRSLALDPSGGYDVLDELCGMVHRVAPGPDHAHRHRRRHHRDDRGHGRQRLLGRRRPRDGATFDNPRGIAATATSMLIADSLNQRIRRVSPTARSAPSRAPASRGVSGEFGPATSAYLAIPRDVETVPGGGFLIADSGVNQMRRVLPDGDIVTIAGTGAAGTSGDGGPATSARLTEPFGINLSRRGDLYISGAGVLTPATSAQQRVRVVSNALAYIPVDASPTAAAPAAPAAPHPTASHADAGSAHRHHPDHRDRTGRSAPPPPTCCPRRWHPPPLPCACTVSVLDGARGAAPRTSLLRIGADRSVAAQRVVVQVGRRVRVHGRRCSATATSPPPWCAAARSACACASPPPGPISCASATATPVAGSSPRPSPWSRGRSRR